MEDDLTYFTGGDIPHYAFGAGIGRYNLLPSSDRRLEVFGGAAYGKTLESPNPHYLQGFLQVNIGKRRRYLETGWAFRSAYSVFHGMDSFWSEKKNEYIIKNHQVFHLEPMFVVRVGGQHVKWFARIGTNLTFPLSSNSFINANGPYDRGYTILHFSTGVSYRF